MFSRFVSLAKVTQRLARRWLAVLAAALALTGCGGGLAIGLDLGYAGVVYQTGFDERPNVSLAASTSAARVGQSVRLVAAASDDYGVDEVIFFAVRESGEAEYITRMRWPPYVIDVVIPQTASGFIHFMARAVDTAGQYRDSGLVRLTVLP